MGSKMKLPVAPFAYLLPFALLTVAGIAQGDVSLSDPMLASARVESHDQTGLVRFIGLDSSSAISLPAAPATGEAADIAQAFVELYGPEFGIGDPARELQLIRVRNRIGGGTSIRYRQVHDGIPVIAGELVVNLDNNNALLSMNGEISPEPELDTKPSVGAAESWATALAAVAKWYQVDAAALRADTPVLAIYDPRLLKPSVVRPSLVWKMEVRSGPDVPIREFVLVDAHTGAINLHFNQIDTAKDRKTYDVGGTDTLPGTLICDETDPNCAAGDADARDAHIFAGDTYDFYASNHGRDGIDDAGGTITSTVHWNDGVTCPNAFWNGSQMVYCDDLVADDAVGHELTHGVTQFESGLFYYYESGAINESLSDVWGEFVDLHNGSGTDTAAVRWLIGEDLSTLGTLRDMADPPAFNDPDRMTSSLYFTGSADNGGVHTNSGVNNKAAYLMTDGDTFNGITVTDLGIAKVAKIYYEAQTNLLTSGSDYADLYSILYQACQNLIGTAGITASDCTQVRKATDAVEMDQEPVPGFNPEADLCPSGLTVDTVAFSDDIEASSNWLTSTLYGTANPWVFLTSYATSGVRSLYAPDIGTISDSVAFTANPVMLPAGAYLHFRHAFGFEASNTFYDGGVIEYSTNGGTTWTDLGSRFDAGQDYGGIVSNLFGNPLGGRNAFVSESHGYVSSRYDLSDLSGQNFQIRFRLASDSTTGGPLGWVVDDVQIYTCAVELPPDPSCSGNNVVIQNRDFTSDANCIATASLDAHTAVTVKSSAEVNFVSPSISLGPGFSVETGGTFKAGN